MSTRQRVVIVGAGFGGLWAARNLARAPCDVVLVDRSNYHTFYPLLYQVGAAELEPEEIVYPIRSIIRRLPNVEFLVDRVREIDVGNQEVQCASATLGYDFLILAAGSAPHFFRVPGAREQAFPLRVLEDGIRVRNHILSCFEEAVCQPDAARRQSLLTFTIIGGGPTGVEFSGALAELINGPLRKDYPTLDFTEVSVVLLEAGERLLGDMPEHLGQYAADRLSSKGVEVRVASPASEITGDGVRLESGYFLSTATVIWTAGVRASSVAEASGMPTDNRGKVVVTPTLQVPGHPEVYVIGDSARLEENGQPLPMVAPVAMQQGEAAARNITLQLRGQQPAPFRYQDRGMLAVVGRNAAVADLGRVKFTGFVAWFLWLAVHIVRLIGFRNRLQVLINWAWAYIFYERGVRLILPAKGEVLGEPAPHEAAARQRSG